MKLTYFSLIALVAVSWHLLPLGAQVSTNSDELASLAQTLVAQQKLIDENQANIDKSLEVIREDLRQAKIYVSRSGKAKVSK